MTTQLLRPSAWFHQVAWRHFSRVQPSAGVTWRRCSVWCSGHPIWCLHLTFDCCHVSYWGSVVNRTISALQLFDFFRRWIHWNIHFGFTGIHSMAWNPRLFVASAAPCSGHLQVTSKFGRMKAPVFSGDLRTAFVCVQPSAWVTWWPGDPLCHV